MLKTLSVVLALAVCTGWSTAQAAKTIQFHPDTIKALAEAIASASKEVPPPPKPLLKKVDAGLKFAADSVTRLTIIVGPPLGLCHLYHWYGWCDETAHTNDHQHDHE